MDVKEGLEETIYLRLQECKLNRVSAKHLRIYFGDHPQSCIEITTDEAIQLPSGSNINLVERIYEFVLSASIGKIVVVGSIILLTLLAGFYFIALPQFAVLFAKNAPKSLEIKMGETYYDQFVSKFTVDSTKTDIMNEFANELIFSNRYNYQFTVVESSVENAFALPGGKIVIFEPIIDLLEEPEELVALLAHESAHVELRHGMQLIGRNLVGFLIASVVFNDFAGISVATLQNLDLLHTLKFSRKLETNADLMGMKLMVENKINPIGMKHLMEHLESLGHDKTVIPNMFQTHPKVEQRINDVENKLKDYPEHFDTNETLECLFKALKRLD